MLESMIMGAIFVVVKFGLPSLIRSFTEYLVVKSERSKAQKEKEREHRAKLEEEQKRKT